MFPLHFKQPTKTMQYPQEFLNESGWASGQLVSHFGVFVVFVTNKVRHVGNLSMQTYEYTKVSIE